jgi:serine/threonine protein phosphatase PrpC
VVDSGGDSASTVSAATFLEQDMTEPLQVEFAGGTLVVYTNRCPQKETANEDAAGVFQLDADSGVAVVADGVGGEQGGQVASGIVVETIQQTLMQSPGDLPHLRGCLIDAVEQANQRILDLGTGSATTMVMVDVVKGEVRPYHAGDSMILLLGSRGKVKWQTIAHSPVGYAVEAGFLDEADAMQHPERHVVSNVVGQPDMRIELGPTLKLAKRDTLVLCSDGLSDNVTVDEIVSTVRKGELIQQVRQLIELAKSRMNADPLTEADVPGKPDDLTVVAIRRQ